MKYKVLIGLLIIFFTFQNGYGAPPPEPQPDISVNPSSKDYGIIDGESSSLPQTFIVKNIGTLSLVINAVSLTGINASDFVIQNDLCSNQTIAQDGTCTVDVVFSPFSGGVVSADISILSDDPNTSAFNVPLSGTGNAPEITVLPGASLVYQDILVGVTADQILTVKNDGTVNLIISGITLPISPFSILADNCSSYALAPTVSCDIKVRFAPVAVGAYSSSFDIQSNDLDESSFTVGLSATAIDLGTDDSNGSAADSGGSTGAANSDTGGDKKGGFCFIATAAYGSYLDPHVKVLRDFRDKSLLTNPIGRASVRLYYRVSPPIADYIMKRESLRTATRWALTPIVYGVKFSGLSLMVGIFVAGILLYRRKRF